MADIRAAIHSTLEGLDDLAAKPGADVLAPIDDQSSLPDPYADQTKWPAWKVTLAVIVFCGAFWTGVGYLVARLLG